MRTGIRRKVDDLGRVVIPAGIRRTLGIREGDAVEVHVEGEQVILAKPTDQCVFCGREEDLRQFRKRSVCRPCIAGVGVIDENIRDDRAPRDATPDRAARSGSLPPWPVSGAPARALQTPGARPAEQRAAADAPDGPGSEDAPAAQGRSDPSADEGEEPPASSTAW